MMVNLPKAQKKYIKLIKPWFFIALIIFISVINGFAQSISIEEAWNDSKGNGSVCGHLENEQLSVPAYKFRVTDKNGAVLKNLRAEGELFIEQGVWTKNGLFDFDPYWKTEYHNIKVSVSYDSQQEVYLTQAIPKIKITERKKGDNWFKKCLDKVTKLRFTFYQNDCDGTGFIFFFPNRTIDKINLPDTKKITISGSSPDTAATQDNKAF